MALSKEKILKIIEEKEHITVKLENTTLMRRIEQMEKEGLVEFADRYRDSFYYRKKGSDWRFFDKSDPRY
jgi:hypothetical protein